MKTTTSLFFMLIGFTISLKAQLSGSQILKIEAQFLKIDQELNLKSHKVPQAEISKNKKMNKEERIVVIKNKNKIVKIEYYSKEVTTGGSESFKIYLRKGKPIYIEKEKNEIISSRPLNGVSKSFEYLIKSKNHVQNWKKNQVEYMLWNEETKKYEYVQGEMKSTLFMSDKLEVLRILKLSKTAVN
jgi:hypothetical protein